VKSGWMMFVILGLVESGDGSGRRVRAKIWVIEGVEMQHFRTACPILPVPPVMMIFMVDVV
jgi:hypothetical protein